MMNGRKTACEITKRHFDPEGFEHDRITKELFSVRFPLLNSYSSVNTTHEQIRSRVRTHGTSRSFEFTTSQYASGYEISHVWNVDEHD